MGWRIEWKKIITFLDATFRLVCDSNSWPLWYQCNTLSIKLTSQLGAGHWVLPVREENSCWHIKRIHLEWSDFIFSRHVQLIYHWNCKEELSHYQRSRGLEFKNWHLSTTKTEQIFCSSIVIAGSVVHFFFYSFQDVLILKATAQVQWVCFVDEFQHFECDCCRCVSSFLWYLKCNNFFFVLRQRLVLFITAFQFSKDRYYYY